MKIVIFGSTGQVGSEIKKKLKNYNLFCPKRSEVNFLNIKKVISYLQCIKPDIIINAAAYTDVSKAQIEKKLCKSINSIIIKKLSIYCKQNKVILLHFSTDYVYDGKSKYKHKENEKLNPKSTYGLSKLLSEKYIINSDCFYIILRTSWVYGGENNFITKINNQIKKNKVFYVVNDQIGSPTPKELLGMITKKLINI